MCQGWVGVNWGVLVVIVWCIVCFGCWVSCRVGGGVRSGGFGVLGECST